jgi:vacuolar-type H+-ATPase subunit H
VIFRVVGSAAAILAVSAAWRLRRGTPRPADRTSAGPQPDVDGRDWIYGDGATRRGAGRPALPVEDAPAPPADAAPVAEDDDGTREQLLEETRRRAELEAKTIVARAEQAAREIVAAAGTAAGDAKTEADDPERDDAQERARELLVAAKAAEARIASEAERAGALLMEERVKLAAFLRELLEEVEGAGALGPQVVDLDQARELRQSVGNSE